MTQRASVNINPSGLTGLTTGILVVTGSAQIGDGAADVVGLYGATPVVQRATAGSHTIIATTVSVSTNLLALTSWGFSTSTQANALISAVAEIQATLVALGIWAA